jgi:hypothetical protein
MTIHDHPLAQTLLDHLQRYRGSWIKKLPLELLDVLLAIDGHDLKRAATLLIHGSSVCIEGHERKFQRISEGWQFCAANRQCPCFMRHFHATAAATNMTKRGVRNAAQSAEVQQKIRKTCLERYGVETSGASKQRQEKAKATNLSRYGVENVFASNVIKQKIRDITLHHHGVDHISKSAQHQQKMREAVQQKYGVDNVGASDTVRQKIRATNQTRYGGPAPSTSAEVRQKMREAFIEQGHPAHQHIDPAQRFMDEDDFRARCSGRKAIDIAKETGYHPSTLYRYAARYGVELDLTGGDHRDTENQLAEIFSGYDAIRRNARILTNVSDAPDQRKAQQIDFYFPAQKLGVELHGAYWHSDALGRDKLYHADKLRMASDQGIRLIQVFEDEWLDHPEAVLATIRHQLGKNGTDRVFARKCSIQVIDYADAVAFYNQHHVFGSVRATVHLGLIHATKLVACMSFTQRMTGVWELVRYATAETVAGGASRLLKAFERNYQWTKIISFADLRWSDGKLYRTLGFALEAKLPPDYAYVIGNRRVHKFNLRKSSKRFAKYAEQGLSERQMAELEGIPRVYDAGKLRFVKTR